MPKEKIEIVVSPKLKARLGDDVEIYVCVKGEERVGYYVEESGQDGDMLVYMENVIAEKNAAGKLRTAETYQSTLNRLRDFLKKTELPWRSVTPKFMEAFAAYLERRGIEKNTLSFYCRIVRAVCNRARKDGYAVSGGLFTDIYTGKAKTRKRALRMDDIKRIANVETVDDKEAFARNMFVFSFITRGMATVDIAHLTTDNINGRRLTYKRHKTEQTVTMEWLDEMQRIADTYHKDGSKYLFPLMNGSGSENRHKFKKLQLRLNYRLKKLGKRLDLPMPLTMYVARHSWATIAKQSGVPTAVISDAMGHSSERTTQIYLDSIDEGCIDSANQGIVSQLFGK